MSSDLHATAGTPARNDAAQFADDARFYLSLQPRQLPSRYFYDALGSALFSAICQLPWYTLTRAETRLLDRHGAEILARAGAIGRIAELGSGDGSKLARLLSARGAEHTALDVHLIDISQAALDEATRTLSVFSGVSVTAHHATYESGLERVAETGGDRSRTLALFLGSNIGNFDPPSGEALLTSIHRCLRPGDALLLGADLVKPDAQLLAAYDDPLGVTAAFNLNLLARINRELHATFDLAGFAHHAIWNGEVSRVEMHLRSLRRQHVTVRDAELEITFEPDELIWTESSYKYEPDGIRATIERTGYRTVTQWIESTDRFALTLAEVV
jgi:dimethylhistidine N-methyltransferase